MKRECGSCHHWCGEVDIDPKTFEIKASNGFCRRYPPFNNRWPNTMSTDTCGEHELRPPAVEDLFPIHKLKE